MERIRLGIVGVGHLGRFHVKVAREIDCIEVVGIYDIDPKRLEEISREFSVIAFEDMDSLLELCDAVSIVVPTHSHFSVAREAIGRGIHVFIEKPLTSTVEEGKLLVEMAREKGIKLQVGHIERFNPAFLSLKGIKLSPMFVEAHRLARFHPRGLDVSVILDLMIHDIDIVLTLIPYPLCSLHACGVPVISASEDIANVRMEFENGAVANLTASRISAKDMRKMRLFQKDQYISIDFLEKKSEIFSLEGVDALREEGFSVTSLGEIGISPLKRTIYMVHPPRVEINSLKMELGEFARSILLDLEEVVSGEQALYSLEVAHRILREIKRPDSYLREGDLTSKG